jgi:hypothetical protein
MYVVWCSGPPLESSTDEALPKVHILMVEAVGVRGVQHPNSIVECEPNDIDGLLFWGALLGGKTKQAEREWDLERAENAVGGYRRHDLGHCLPMQ